VKEPTNIYAAMLAQMQEPERLSCGCVYDYRCTRCGKCYRCNHQFKQDYGDIWLVACPVLPISFRAARMDKEKI
jgi:hypothetical protein